MMTKDMFTKIVNIMTPLGRGSCAGTWQYSENGFLSYPLLVYTWAWIRHIKHIIMMTMVGSINIFKITTPEADILC